MATKSIDNKITATQKENVGMPQLNSIYACPTCRQGLDVRDEGLYCRVCAVTYPILDGIPDFIVEKLEESSHHDLRVIGKWDSSFLLDFMAHSYEACISAGVQPVWRMAQHVFERSGTWHLGYRGVEERYHSGRGMRPGNLQSPCCFLIKERLWN